MNEYLCGTGLFISLHQTNPGYGSLDIKDALHPNITRSPSLQLFDFVVKVCACAPVVRCDGTSARRASVGPSPDVFWYSCSACCYVRHCVCWCVCIHHAQERLFNFFLVLGCLPLSDEHKLVETVRTATTHQSVTVAGAAYVRCASVCALCKCVCVCVYICVWYLLCRLMGRVGRRSHYMY